MSTIVKPTIFREYIGVKPHLDNLLDFPDIINPNITEFHFILGFAKEQYDNNRRGNGNFNPTWNDEHFSREHIRALKQRRENAKVLISIGGVDAESPFNPAEREVWPYRAIASLKNIINIYGDLIDGIDINYEFINSNDIDFANCIGKVINGLRNHGLVKLVSIAPSAQVQPRYRRLYVDHGRDIDWVNYKFYMQNVPSAADFIALYRGLSNDYHVAKVLAGFSTDPVCQGVTRDVFREGCIDLLRNKSLPGIFVWNANDSTAFPTPNENQTIEEIAQNLLINPPY